MGISERKTNSSIVMKNSIIGSLAQILSMIISFVSQRLFLKILGLEVLGVNSVVGETLGFLTFAELGVGSAITFRLYKPLVNNDERELTSLMQLYRTLYRIIGVIVFSVGCILMFFLPFFVSDTTKGMGYIYGAYVIQLFSTSSTYFFSYKRTLVYADQKQYICKIVDILTNMFYSCIRIGVLLAYKNYHFYLLVQLLQTLTSNIIIVFYCNKHYSYVTAKEKIKYHDIKGMFSDTKNILLGKIAGYVYSSTDNLVISKFSGLVVAGGFSNYKYVINAVKNLMHGMTDSITATIGNNVQQRNHRENYMMFRRYTYIRFVVVNVAAVGLCVCTDLFIAIVFGKQYILERDILFLMVIDIFIGVIYGPSAEFASALGYFKEGRDINIIGAIINLGISVLLASVIGVKGVIIGTCVSQLFFLISYSVLIVKKYFVGENHVWRIWFSYLQYAAVTFVEIIVLLYFKDKIWGANISIIELMVFFGAAIVFPILVDCLLWGRTMEHKYLLEIIKKVIKVK